MHLMNVFCTCVVCVRASATSCGVTEPPHTVHKSNRKRHDNIFTMTIIGTIMLVFLSVNRIQQTNTDALTDTHTHAKPMRALHH